MTITQTIDVTDDYRVMLEIPRSIPKGKTNVIIQFPTEEKPNAEPQPSAQGVASEMRGSPLYNDIPRFTEKEFEELMKDCPHTEAISGILSSLGDVDLDEWRMKRLAKHL
jgi:hypothetical protein